MEDCLARFGGVLEPSLRTTHEGGHLDFSTTHASAEKLQLALAHGFGFQAAADGIIAAGSRCLAACALPKEVSVSLSLPASLEPQLEDVVLGVSQACSAEGFVLSSLRWSQRDAANLTVRARGHRQQQEQQPCVGDEVVALAANGLHEHGHGSALAAALSSGGLGSQALRRIFARQKSYLGVMRRPLLEGWYRCALSVDPIGLVEGLKQKLPTGVALDLSPAPWPEVDGLSWMLEPAQDGSNLGVGMALFVPRERAVDLVAAVAAWGEPAWRIARLVDSA